MTCKAVTDAHGTSYIIDAVPPVKTPKGRTLRGYPALDVWWSRDNAAKAEETMVIRQEYEDRTTADVIELTQGQVYDLIDALNKAMEAK